MRRPRLVVDLNELLRKCYDFVFVVLMRAGNVIPQKFIEVFKYHQSGIIHRRRSREARAGIRGYFMRWLCHV
jgi:hypothetical protein